MKISISPFSIDAYEKIMDLWTQSRGVGLSKADSKESIRAYLERNPGLSLIAKDPEGNIVGAVLCGHDGRRGYIHHLAVHPNCRRQGIGRSLIRECLSRLHEVGIQKCHLFIFKENKEGAEFWKYLGWTDRKDIGVMSKDIT